VYGYVLGIVRHTGRYLYKLRIIDSDNILRIYALSLTCKWVLICFYLKIEIRCKQEDQANRSKRKNGLN